MNASSPPALSVGVAETASDRPDRSAALPRRLTRRCVVVAAVERRAAASPRMNDAAARLGLMPGMALADARAMYPALPVADADPEADAQLLEAIADWCDRYTPLVGLDPPDGLMLDITGCAHLFGGEAALCRDLVARLARQGLRSRAAVADTVGCAWGMARYGDFAQPAPLPPRSAAKRWGRGRGWGASRRTAGPPPRRLRP